MTASRTPQSTAPVVFGSVGLGGYAKLICDTLLKCGDAPDNPPIRLAAVFEPVLAQHERTVQQLAARGVQVFDRLEPLLEMRDIEAIALPVPIHLHRRYTEQCLAAGKAVMCEKPAAGSVDDCDAMIAAMKKSGLPVAIGFQDVYDPVILEAKRAVLIGDIGPVKTVTMRACWPRDSLYFSRNNWAGALKRDGVWVMDSPAMNALSHFIHLSLFMVGTHELSFATPLSVEAELYRANDIENFDTGAFRWQTDVGAQVVVLMTHACEKTVDPLIVLHGEWGAVEITFAQVTVRNRGGVRVIPRPPDPRPSMVAAWADVVRGRKPDVPVGTLEMARAHLVAVNGASEAARVHEIEPRHIESRSTRDGEAVLRFVTGIESVIKQCAAHARLPHESGLAPWAKPPGQKDLRGYNRFAGPKI
jgi:predicted dehydrogenase